MWVLIQIPWDYPTLLCRESKETLEQPSLLSWENGNVLSTLIETALFVVIGYWTAKTKKLHYRLDSEAYLEESMREATAKKKKKSLDSTQT